MFICHEIKGIGKGDFMFNIEEYMARLIRLLKETFGERLLYVGLQGSFLRGEAKPNSDIDVMVVINDLSVWDMDAYRTILQTIGDYERSCGFICSKQDLAAWNPLEICHVLHSTKDYHGVLRDLIPVYTAQDIRNFVKMSLNNLYHEICHRYIHADLHKNIETLPQTYKGVFFILQNWYYLTHGRFVVTKAELLRLLDGKNKAILERAVAFGNGESCDFAENFALLFTWCQETLASVSS